MRVLIACEYPIVVKSIVGFPAYRVASDGVIASNWRTGPHYPGMPSVDKWTALRQNERPDGYLYVELRSAVGGRRKIAAHILVCEAFHGSRPTNRHCVRHLDGNPGHNCSHNLAWGTYRENENDKRSHGTWESRFGGAKLSPAQREAAFEMASRGTPQRLIAERLCVSRPTISRLLSGSTWK